jgi:hypothetical protein
MASGDTWKVSMKMLWGTVGCRPGFYLVEGGGGAGLNPSENVSLAVEAAFGAGALTGFSDQLSWIGNTITDVSPGVLPTQDWDFATAAIGTVADVNPLPPQSAGVISLKTGIKGSVGVYAAAGRIYMPGIPQNGQISGFLEGAFQTDLSNWAQALIDAFVLDATAYQLFIISLLPGSKPVSIRASNPVTGYSINNVVRSQRRREFGVGI